MKTFAPIPTLPKQSEDELQKSCIVWFSAQYPHLWKAKRLHAVPNGGKRDAREAAKFKAAGLVPGVCDLHLTIPKSIFHGAFFELKVGKNTLSEHQKVFIEEHQADYFIRIIYSLEEFIAAVKQYLSMPQTNSF